MEFKSVACVMEFINALETGVFHRGMLAQERSRKNTSGVLQGTVTPCFKLNMDTFGDTVSQVINICKALCVVWMDGAI